jgi:hypothetical protein
MQIDVTRSETAMGLAAPQSTFSATDYLAWEAEQPERHEFLDGMWLTPTAISTQTFW